MRCTVETESPLAVAIPRELQCVTFAGVLSSVRTITASMRASSIVRGMPGRYYKYFEIAGNVIALNSKGGPIYAMLAGVFQKNGVDLNKLTVIDVGGSGSRVKARCPAASPLSLMHSSRSGAPRQKYPCVAVRCRLPPRLLQAARAVL